MLHLTDFFDIQILHILLHLFQKFLRHSNTGIFYFQTDLSLFLIYTYKHPALRRIPFDSKYTGILHKSHQTELWNQIHPACIIQLNLIRKSFSKTILLKFQISLNKSCFLTHGHIIVSPFHILPFHNSQHLHHMRRFILFLYKTVHTNALQRVKQEMRIDLAVKRKQFCVLTGDIDFLFLQFFLINRLYQFILPGSHPVIIPDQNRDLIVSGCFLHDGKFFRLAASGKHLAKTTNPFCQRPIDISDKYPWKENINTEQRDQNRNIFLRIKQKILIPPKDTHLQFLSIKLKTVRIICFRYTVRRFERL